MWILGLSGFVANVGQSSETMHTLRLLMSFIPAGFAVATAVATLFYKIDRKMEHELEHALSEMGQTSDPVG
jgi:Na+/melibiose symporter-like transporter